MEAPKKPKGSVQSSFVPPTYNPNKTDEAFNSWVEYISKEVNKKAA